MSGNKEGAAKARATILKKNPDFYREIGGQSWKNPDRSRETGFAILAHKNKEEHLEISKKGGQKTKEDYHTTKTKEVSTDISE